MPNRTGGAEERLRKLLDFQSVLARVARELGPALELDVVLKSVLSAMRSLVDFRGGTIQLVDGDHIRVAASDPPISEEVEQSRIRVGEGISGRAVVTQETIYVPDLDADPRIDPGQRARGSNALMKSYLATPLVCLGEVIGLLQVDSAKEDAFDEEDRTLLEGLAVQVAGAIESARRYEAMRDLEQLRTDFVARVSHELRTPVAIAAGFVETLLSEPQRFDGEQRLRMLQRVAAAITRLGSLIERMLVVTSVEAGAIRPAPAPTVVGELLHAVRDEAARPEDVTIVEPRRDTWVLDAKIARQILGLLVDNALLFAGDAELSVDGPALVVRDHGPGIDAAVRRHAFQGFVRGQGTGPGMGIGLHLASMLAEVCDARLELVEAPDGVGAMFRLVFAPPDGAGGRSGHAPQSGPRR